MVTRADVVRVARSYIGTPFAHAQRSPGIGMDCAGVLVCVARELQLVYPDFDVPAYVPEPDGRSMMAWLGEYMGPRVSEDEMQPGDAVVMVSDQYPQHLGILGDYRYGGLSIVHASNSRTLVPPRVIETRLMFSRRQRFVAAFAFPGIY